jgi:hypothetical protein
LFEVSSPVTRFQLQFDDASGIVNSLGFGSCLSQCRACWWLGRAEPVRDGKAVFLPVTRLYLAGVFLQDFALLESGLQDSEMQNG